MNTQFFEQLICQLKEVLHRLQNHQNILQPCREYRPVRQSQQQRQKLRRYYS